MTGAGGFVGSAVVRLLEREGHEVRALYRSSPSAAVRNVVAIRGDMADAAALRALLAPATTLVNCAYDGTAAPAQNVAAARQLARACVEHGVRRVIHCSTAVVAGRAARGVVDESTVPQPATPYEITKLEIERAFAETAREGFELVILRPTAVFGPGGRNLAKLAAELDRGPRTLAYLRSCVNGRRRMNLVAVENVVAAIAFLVTAPRRFEGDVFIVSDDDAPENNYRDVERALMRALEVPDYAVPPVTVPRGVLSVLLRLRGRTMSDPDAIFASDRLAREHFVKPVSFGRSLAVFGEWCRGESPRPARAAA